MLERESLDRFLSMLTAGLTSQRRSHVAVLCHYLNISTLSFLINRVRGRHLTARVGKVVLYCFLSHKELCLVSVMSQKQKQKVGGTCWKESTRVSFFFSISKNHKFSANVYSVTCAYVPVCFSSLSS